MSALTKGKRFPEIIHRGGKPSPSLLQGLLFSPSSVFRHHTYLSEA